MLIKRAYEFDPLFCPKCQAEMKVVAFLEPPQGEVIEKILRHCGLWHSSRVPPADKRFVHDPHADGQSDSDEPRELTFVAEDGIWPTPSPTTWPTTGIASRPRTSPGI